MAQTKQGALKAAATKAGITFRDYARHRLIYKRKLCRTCRGWKYPELFHFDRSKHDGLQSECKVCRKASYAKDASYRRAIRSIRRDGIRHAINQ